MATLPVASLVASPRSAAVVPVLCGTGMPAVVTGYDDESVFRYTEPTEIRRRDLGGTIATDISPAQVVSHDPDEVHTRFG